MDSILPVQLKQHIKITQLNRLKDKGIDVTNTGFKLYAQCKDDIDEKTVKTINENTPLIKDYYGGN